MSNKEKKWKDLSEQEKREFKEYMEKKEQKKLDDEATALMWHEQAARAKRETDRLVKQVKDLSKPELAFTKEPERSTEVLKCKRVLSYLLNEPKERGSFIVMGTQYKVVDDAHNGIFRVQTLKGTPERNLSIVNNKYGEPMELHMKYPYPMDILKPRPLWKIWEIKLEEGELPRSPTALQSYALLNDEVKALEKEYGSLKLKLTEINRQRKNALIKLRNRKNAIEKADKQLVKCLGILESRLFKNDLVKALIEEIREVLTS
ncbi:MAG: hypothetical protein NWE90_02410 [Candidatus Bathyarchaeota archaeon]|nr:hypothetical protein [Candidatus Bathyarchaeota archaeon]